MDSQQTGDGAEDVHAGFPHEPALVIPTRSFTPQVVLAVVILLAIIALGGWTMITPDLETGRSEVRAESGRAGDLAEEHVRRLRAVIQELQAHGFHRDGTSPCSLPVPGDRDSMGTAWASASAEATSELNSGYANHVAASAPDIRNRAIRARTEEELADVVSDARALTEVPEVVWVLLRRVWREPRVQRASEALPTEFGPGLASGSLLAIQGDEVVCAGDFQAESSERIDYLRFGDIDTAGSAARRDLLQNAFASGLSNMHALRPLPEAHQVAHDAIWAVRARLGACASEDAGLVSLTVFRTRDGVAVVAPMTGPTATVACYREAAGAITFARGADERIEYTLVSSREPWPRVTRVEPAELSVFPGAAAGDSLRVSVLEIQGGPRSRANLHVFLGPELMVTRELSEGRGQWSAEVAPSFFTSAVLESLHLLELQVAEAGLSQPIEQRIRLRRWPEAVTLGSPVSIEGPSFTATLRFERVPRS